MKSFRSFLPAVALAFASLVAAAVFTLFPPNVSEAHNTHIDVYSTTWNPGSLVDGAGETSTLSVPGVVLGDTCLASLGVDIVDMTLTCYVQASGAIEFRLQNESGSTADLASTTVRAFVFRKGTR